MYNSIFHSYMLIKALIVCIGTFTMAALKVIHYTVKSSLDYQTTQITYYMKNLKKYLGWCSVTCYPLKKYQKVGLASSITNVTYL